MCLRGAATDTCDLRLLSDAFPSDESEMEEALMNWWMVAGITAGIIIGNILYDIAKYWIRW